MGRGGEAGVGRCSVCGTWRQSTRRFVISKNSNEKVWGAQRVTVLAVAQM